MTYVASAGRNDTNGMLFSFNDGPVSGVGGFMNYVVSATSQLDHLIITAYDSGMNVLERYNITNVADIVTPDGYNDGAFRGILRSSPDIAYFEVSGEGPVLDNLTFSGSKTLSSQATSYQDWWNNTDLSGMGLNVGQQGNNVFVSWFMYQEDENP